MKTLHSFFIIAILFVANLTSQTSYTWDNVIVGGGGYVTGVLVHPQEPNLRYIRTDIGGMFRWNESDKRWVQLFGSFGPEQDNLYGVDGFAIDPNNTEIIYAALGKYALFASGIYKSENRGKSWRKLRDEPFAGNWKFREIGENLMVDPNNSNIVYCGTRLNGLLRSTDGGENWSKVNSVPNGYVGNAANYWDKPNNPLGVRSVDIDKNTGAVYAAVYSDGVYKSTDNGTSFYKIAGSPSNNLRVIAAPGNLLYCTTENGVYSYDQNNWRKLPIQTSGYDIFNGFAVDPFNENNLLTVTGAENPFQRAYRSTDKGESWEELYSFNGNINIFDNTWHSGNAAFFHAASASVAFDPHKSGTVYTTDWYQIWRCENIFDNVTDWYNDVAGHEEIVVLALASSPQGTSLFSGQGDVVGFKHYNQSEVPIKRLTEKAECTGIDYAEKDPSKMALVSADDWYGKNTQIFVSNDSGDNFSPVNKPANGANGKIAVASNDGNNLVYVWGGSQPYFSRDGGNSWNSSNGASQNALLTTYMYQYDDPLIASKNENNTFYIFDRSAGTLFKSTDGGANWFVVNNTFPVATSQNNDILFRETVNLTSGWGQNSNLMVVSLGAKGLWISNDSGVNFTKNENFELPLMSSMGKSQTPGSTPAIFVYGKRNGTWGIYISDDSGSSWRRINDDNNLVGNSPTMMKGDRQVYGKVYVGTNGSGLFYGEMNGGVPNPNPTPNPNPNPSTCSSYNLINGNFELNGFQNWEATNNTSLEDAAAHVFGGTYAAGAWWGGSVSTTISDLESNTSYNFSVYARNLEDNKNGSVQIKGGVVSEGQLRIDATTYKKFTLNFTTDNSNNPVQIVLNAPTEAMSVFDDAFLDCANNKAATLTNNERLRIYPNPAQNRIQVQFNQQIDGVVRIYSLDGKLLIDRTIESPLIDINIADFPKGFYILKFIPFENANDTSSYKFIKE